MQYIITPSFSVLINGSPPSFFKINRGLRQGNPLSSYLLIMLNDVLIHKLYKAESLNLMKGIKISKQNENLNYRYLQMI